MISHYIPLFPNILNLKILNKISIFIFKLDNHIWVGFIFSIPRSGKKAKRGVEFHHSESGESGERKCLCSVATFAFVFTVARLCHDATTGLFFLL